MKGVFNAANAYARLVEDCRLGLCGRPKSRGRGIIPEFIPHAVAIADFAAVPVFYFPPQIRIDFDVLEQVLAAVERKEFRLPYPRCSLMMSVPPGHAGLQSAPHKMQHVRHSYVVVAEEDDDAIRFTPFMRNGLMDHWAQQLLTAELTGEGLKVSYDPSWGGFPQQFMEIVVNSLVGRLEILLVDLQRMMNPPPGGGGGRVSQWVPSNTRITERRTRLGLPPIPPVRIVHLDAPVAATAATNGSGSGGRRRLHAVRGAWHTRKATGHRSFHRAHERGGGGEPPTPWYEVL